MSRVCMNAKAVEEGEKRKDPSWDWSFKSFSQSKSRIPSKLCNNVVGILCIISFGILQKDITRTSKINSYFSIYILRMQIYYRIALLLALSEVHWTHIYTFKYIHINIECSNCIFLAQHTNLVSFSSFLAYISFKTGESYGTSMFISRAISSNDGNATSNPIGICSSSSSSSFPIFSRKNVIPEHIKC